MRVVPLSRGDARGRGAAAERRTRRTRRGRRRRTSYCPHRYLGITGLAQVVEGHPRYAAEHQLAVIDCLASVDDTLKRKTLDLLYRMMNPVNVEFIASKLLESLEGSNDEFLRTALVSRLCTAAERFAPSNAWYVATVTRVRGPRPDAFFLSAAGFRRVARRDRGARRNAIARIRR